jgi:hypothetical protein
MQFHFTQDFFIFGFLGLVWIKLYLLPSFLPSTTHDDATTTTQDARLDDAKTIDPEKFLLETAD